jgi:hypothetical protein
MLISNHGTHLLRAIQAYLTPRLNGAEVILVKQ